MCSQPTMSSETKYGFTSAAGTKRRHTTEEPPATPPRQNAKEPVCPGAPLRKVLHATLKGDLLPRTLSLPWMDLEHVEAAESLVHLRYHEPRTTQ